MTELGLMKTVKKLNNFNYKDACTVHNCVPFCIEDRDVGVITLKVLKEILNHPDVFMVKEEMLQNKLIKKVCFVDNIKTVEVRDSAVAEMLEEWRKNKRFKCLNGWRDEKYSIYADRAAPPMLHMERSACSLFGVIKYGVHINGYTFHDGKLKMWVGRRSKTKQLYPGLLDQMCAGGLSKGLGIRECAVKECVEEASVDPTSLEKLKSVGAISYCFEDDLGIHADTEYVFDLELSPDFVPSNADGEMDSFFLYDMDELLKLIQTPEFKPNSAVVVLDFLMRHGIVTHDSEPRYLILVEQMHKPLQPSV